MAAKPIPVTLRPLRVLTLPASLEPLYVIGDIHGCWDALQVTLAKIDEHAQIYGVLQPRIVFVGDYIDRGPDSVRVWDWIFADSPKYIKHLIAGNHEQLAELSLYGTVEVKKPIMKDWLLNGGLDALKSILPVPEQLITLDPDLIARVQKVFTFQQFCMFYNIVCWEQYVITHASLNPSLSIHDQGVMPTLWSRAHRPIPNKVVIHGHSIDPNGPDMRSNVLNVDIGSFRYNQICAIAVWASGRKQRIC